MPFIDLKISTDTTTGPDFEKNKQLGRFYRKDILLPHPSFPQISSMLHSCVSLSVRVKVILSLLFDFVI